MSGEVKRSQKRSAIYCCHRPCTSSTLFREDGVKLIPFPKPCDEYISTIVDSNNVHNTKKCPRCSKCLRWIHLCKRADSRLKELYDIKKQTYICTKHFVNGVGPTDTDPDPYPADAADVHRKPPRRAPKERPLLPPRPAKKRRVPVPPDPLELPDVKIEFCDPDADGWPAQEQYTDKIGGQPEDFAALEDHGPEDFAALEDHGYNRPIANASPHVPKPANSLKAIAHCILEHGLYVKFDQESLSVSAIHGHLAEKTCVVDRNLSVQLYVLGKPVQSSNRIWRTHPKVWNPEFDYMFFLKDFFENWFVCRPTMERSKLMDVKGRMRDSDPFTFDTVTQTLRAHECSLLSPKPVCFYCHKMMRSKRLRKKSSEACRKVSRMTKEEARKELQETRIKLTYEKRKNIRKAKKLEGLTKKVSASGSNVDNIDPLSCILTNGDWTESSELAKIFFAEQIKAAKEKSPEGYRWHPLMTQWCLSMQGKSPATYSALRNVFILPSQLRLTDVKPSELEPSDDFAVEYGVQELGSSGNEDEDLDW